MMQSRCANADDRGGLERARGQGAVVVVLALVALAGGAALGVGSVFFGGTVVPFARRITPSPSPGGPHAMAYAAVLLTIVASGGGALLARRASSAEAAPSWLLALGRPYELLALAARGLGRAAGFLERGVSAMERGIIDDIPTAFGDIYRRIRGVDAADDEDEPAEGSPAMIAGILVMVVLLAAIALSALVLG